MANTPMQAGQLRRKLTILSRATTSTAGGYTESNTPILTTWGSVTVSPQNRQIAVVGGQLMAQSQYLITLRYPPSTTISPGMRVQDGAKVYRVHQVADIDERHRTLQLLCVEQPAS